MQDSNINSFKEENFGLSGAVDMDPLSLNDLRSKNRLPGPPPKSPELQQYLDEMHGVNKLNYDLPQPSTQSIQNMVLNAHINGIGADIDPFKDAKPVMGDFSNPKIHHQFAERYKKHPKFDQLGFSPFRDNEALYSSEGNYLDDLKRAGGQWVTIAGLGFMDALSFGSISDKEVASDYERAMAIGSSSYSGFAGFSSNLFLNSGYTIGIMTEMATEEGIIALAQVGLGVAGLYSGGFAWSGNVALGARTAARFGKAFKAIGKSAQYFSKMLKQMDNVKDINNARKAFYNAGKGVVHLVNPLENTTDFIKNYDKLDKFNRFAKTYNGFASFYRDVRNIRLAWGESGLEGGMVTNQVAQELLDEFIEKHGRYPNNEEATRINELATAAGYTTGQLNVPVIYLTNKLTFDGLVRGTFRGLNTKMLTTAMGRRILLSPKKGIPEAFKAVPKGFLKSKLPYLKNPKMFLSGFTRYTSANLAEGFQETFQETVAGASHDYYKGMFDGGVNRGGYMYYLASNLKKQVTTQEGFEVFMSGFLMGGFISPVSNTIAAVTRGPKGFENSVAGNIGGYVHKQAMKMRYGANSAEYKQYVSELAETEARKEELLEKDVELLNQFYKNPMTYLSEDFMNLMSQQKFKQAFEEAQKNGDIKSMVDMMDVSSAEHILTALKYGRMDSFVQRLTELQKLSPEDIKNDWNIEAEDFNNALELTKQRAKKIEARWELAQSKYPNPYDPSNKLQVFKHKAWENAIKDMVFKHHAFDRALERQVEILNFAAEQSGLKKVNYTDIAVMFNDKDLVAEVERLQKDIELIEAAGSKPTSEAGKIASDKKEKLKTLKAVQKAFDDIFVAEGIGENESIPENLYNAAYEAFTKYMEYLAKTNNDLLQNDNTEALFKQIMDYYILGLRGQLANQWINQLNNPEAFMEDVENKVKILKAIHEDRKDEIRQALKSFIEQREKNDIFNALYDKGFFINPEAYDLLMKEGVMPKEFFYVDKNSNTWNAEVPFSSEDYKTAVKIIQDLAGFEVTGIDIVESEYDHYRMFSRSKEVGDVRTYNDILKQYLPEGSDINAERTVVPLARVLETIIESEYSSDRDAALATELLKLVAPNETVTFSKTENLPSVYTESEQSVIDARYAAHNYGEGSQNVPIEFAILHAEIQRRVTQAIENDPQFRSELDILYKEALKAYESLTPEQQKHLGRGYASKVPMGLASLQQFTTAAMTNQHFQEFLATIETKTKVKTSTWKKFVDAVLEKLMELLGKKHDGTVLNATLGILTTKFDTFLIEQIAGEETGTVSQEVVVEETKVEEAPVTENEQVASELGAFTRLRVVMIANKLSSRNKLTTEEQRLMDTIPELKKEVDVLLKSRTESKAKTLTKSKPIKDALEELGYTDLEIGRMTPSIAHGIVQDNLTKTDRERLTKPVKKVIEKTTEQKTEESINKLREALFVVEDLTDLENLENSLLEGGIEGVDFTLISDEVWKEMVDTIKNKLNTEINIAMFKEGEIVIMNDKYNSKAKVISITADTVILEYMKGQQKRITIKADKLQEKIKYKLTKAGNIVMGDGGVAVIPEAPSEESVDTSKESVANAADVHDIDTIEEDIETAKGANLDDLNNDLISKICK